MCHNASRKARLTGSKRGCITIWGFYDSPELARQVVPDDDVAKFEVFAYELYPVEFVDGEETVLSIAPGRVVPLDASFDQVGYDVVSRSSADFFECSPLSCNRMAEEVSVNRHCLVETVEEALRLAAQVEASGCEPGPYYVFRVCRQNTVP